MSDTPAESRTAPRIAVCVPTGDQVQMGFANDLARFMGWSSLNLTAPGHIEGIHLHCLSGTLVHTARQRLAEAALVHDPDYILWIDSDMRFPRDVLHRLLKHRQPFVGINYSTRGIPPRFVASVKARWEEDDERVPCVTDEEATGLERVEVLGFGLVLIRTDVFAALPKPRGENGTWFDFDWNPKTNSPIGEDVYFCRAARQAGFQPMVDHDLSKECAHIGTFEYRPDHVSAFQEEVE